MAFIDRRIFHRRADVVFDALSFLSLSDTRGLFAQGGVVAWSFKAFAVWQNISRMTQFTSLLYSKHTLCLRTKCYF